MWSHTSNKKKGGEEMTAVTKYRYITLLNLTQAYARMTTEERAKWNARNRELQKKYDLTLLFGGSSYGTPETGCIVFESEKGLDNFNKFMTELVEHGTPRAREYIASSHTIVIV